MTGLLRSQGGVELSLDICLIIMEYCMYENAKVVGNLLLVSKHFQRLLESYKTSILKAMIQDDPRLAFVNISADAIHASSRMTPGEYTTNKMTYPWHSEVQFRTQTLDFLVQHEILEMIDPQHHWPTLNVPKSELEKRLSLFKRDGLHLIYRLSDSGAGCKTKAVVRGRQAKFLEEELSVSDLATLGAIVEIMGQGFYNITSNALQQSGLLNSSGIQFSNLSTSILYRPSSVPIQDLNSQHWINECMCVFEDLIQRYGPCFAYAYVDGWKHKTRKPDIWARMMLQKGLDDMNAFEMGHTMSFASLQSVVWKVFCRKASCEMQYSWDRAKEIVEQRMSEYVLENETERRV